MEMLQIVGETTGEPTGLCLSRSEALANKAWCRSTNVFVLDSTGRILCHQRSAQKERLPGVWMTHLGGHVGNDETYETNAHKELAEEAGLLVDPSSLIAWRTTRMEHARLWAREFVTVVDSDVSLVPQEGEVDGFRWMTPEEVVRESEADTANWCAGTHDFLSEYQCLRAAITAVAPYRTTTIAEGLHIWHPVGVTV